MERSSPVSGSPDPRLMQVILAVEDSLDLPWSLDDMATRAGLSPSRFAHRFREAVGEAPGEYVTRLRLERAALHLIYSDWPVTEVAMAAGYQTHAGFTHAFVARYDMSPNAFRSSRRRRPFLRGWAWQGRKGGSHRGQSGPPPLPVQVVRMPSFRIAFFRQWGGLLPVPRVWMDLIRWARSRGLDGPDAGPVGFNYDDLQVTPYHRCRYDAGLIVDDDFEPDGQVAVRDVPAGLMVQMSFEGSLMGLWRAWASLI